MSYTGPHTQQDQIVLSDTLNEWREKTNQHADILNSVKVYDVVHGDGITYGRVGGSITLEIAPYIAKGLTIAGDLEVQGNIHFTGTAGRFDMQTITVDDHQIELGASGPNDGPGAADAGVDDGGIIVLSTDFAITGHKRWTWRHQFGAGNLQAWVSNQHIGISAGKSFVSEDDIIRLIDKNSNGLHVEFGTDASGLASPVTDISYATGLTASMFGVPNDVAGSTAWHAAGGGTGGIRIRQDGMVEILRGVNRKIIDKVHDFEHGEVVRWNGSDWIRAQADSESGAEIFGVVDRHSHNNTNQFVVVTHGEITGFSGGGGGGNAEGVQLVSGEIHFLDPDVAGALTIKRTYAKGSVVKPVLFGLSETTGYVLNYIGGIVPDQDIIANAIPQTWRIVADGSNFTYGLSGSASTVAGSHIVSINGVMQIPENDGGTYGSGTGITFGITGGTGPASFRIVEGPGPFTFGNGNRIEFAEPPLAGAEVLVVNHALTTPFEAIKETYLKSTGTTEARLLIDRLGDYVSVKDFGAMGDGVTDDTIAIQRALDQSVTDATENKKRIFFPIGDYLTTQSLVLRTTGSLRRNGMHLYGEGMGSNYGTNILFRGETGPILKTDFDTTGAFNYKFKCSDMRFTNDAVGGASAGISIDCSGMENASFESVKAQGSTADVENLENIGFLVTGNSTLRFIDCAAVRYSKAFCLMNTGPGINRPLTNVLIESAVIGTGETTPDGTSPNTYGIFIDGLCGGTGCESISIRNCSIGQCDFAVSIQGPNNNIEISQNNFGEHPNKSSFYGLTADGQTTNLILMGNTGSLNGNTGAAFFNNDTFQNRIEIENGSVSGVNIPKVIVLFHGSDGGLIGGTGSGASGTNYNIDGIDYNGVGDYTINFTTDLQTDNYSIQGIVGGTAGIVYGGDRSTVSESSCDVFTKHIDNYACNPEYISVTII